MKAPNVPSGRLMSLDALRGFDMFWILGADALVHALSEVNGSALARFLAGQLTHKDWAGLAFYDLIFPLFIFISGVSLTYSLSRQIAEHGRAVTARRVVTRGLILFLIGIFYSGGFTNPWPDMRLLGVLQRIALAYTGAGLLFCFLRPRALAGAAAALLVGYWALLTFVPAPGRASVSFDEGQNIVNWVDAHYLPFRKWDGDHDPEGLLSTLPAVASCLIGVLTGMWMVRKEVPDLKKLRMILAAGVALLVLGYGGGQVSPIIKKLWTPTYVLVAGGWSLLLLGVFFWVIDIRGWQRWARPFVWIGMNPITLYLLVHVMSFDDVASNLVGGPVASALDARVPGLGGVGVSVVGIGLCLALARFLYLKKLFLRL